MDGWGGVDVRSGRAELLADADRPGGWLLLLDRIRQSYVDLDNPTYLDFEYIRILADVLDALPAGPLRITHVGGGGLTSPAMRRRRARDPVSSSSNRTIPSPPSSDPGCRFGAGRESEFGR